MPPRVVQLNPTYTSAQAKYMLHGSSMHTQAVDTTRLVTVTAKDDKNSCYEALHVTPGQLMPCRCCQVCSSCSDLVPSQPASAGTGIPAVRCRHHKQLLLARPQQQAKAAMQHHILLQCTQQPLIEPNQPPRDQTLAQLLEILYWSLPYTALTGKRTLATLTYGLEGAVLAPRASMRCIFCHHHA